MNTRPHRRRWPTILGVALLTIYLVWNAVWLAGGRIPPSLLTGLTGLPSPTTGGTRSFVALAQGDYASSLYYHPLTIPILALLTVTLLQIVCKGRGETWLKTAWIWTIGIAWAVKLLSPPDTW